MASRGGHEAKFQTLRVTPLACRSQADHPEQFQSAAAVSCTGLRVDYGGRRTPWTEVVNIHRPGNTEV
eukprot:209023-Pyramimonas_sp.AAC.1